LIVGAELRRGRVNAGMRNQEQTLQIGRRIRKRISVTFVWQK
jgi:hypothetical protein